MTFNIDDGLLPGPRPFGIPSRHTTKAQMEMEISSSWNTRCSPNKNVNNDIENWKNALSAFMKWN